MLIKDKINPASASICFDCEKACGQCSWSGIDPEIRDLGWKLPEGALAEEVYDKHGKFLTYWIYQCPLFEKTPPRKGSGGILPEEDMEEFLDNPIRFLENGSGRARKRKRQSKYTYPT